MRTTFNNTYTACLRKLLTGPGYTPPSGKEMQEMIQPLKWAVYKMEDRKRYEEKKVKLIRKNPGLDYPEYVHPPEEHDELHPLPVRTKNRSNWFTYFMVGPMSEALHGYKTAVVFNVLHTPSTSDRTTTSRKYQRKKKKTERKVYTLTHLHTHSLSHSLTPLHSLRYRMIEEAKARTDCRSNQSRWCTRTIP